MLWSPLPDCKARVRQKVLVSKYALVYTCLQSLWALGYYVSALDWMATKEELLEALKRHKVTERWKSELQYRQTPTVLQQLQ